MLPPVNTQLESDPGLQTLRLRSLVSGVDVIRQRMERLDEALSERALRPLWQWLRHGAHTEHGKAITVKNF